MPRSLSVFRELIHFQAKVLAARKCWIYAITFSIPGVCP